MASVQPHSSSDPYRKASNSKRPGKDGEDERIVKPRSSKACQPCRTRKVRCDVAAKRARCTNCEIDHLECVVLPSRRGQGNRSKRNKQAGLSRTTRSETSGRHQTSLFETNHQPSQPSAQATHATSPHTGDVPAVVTFDDEMNDQQREPNYSELPSQSCGLKSAQNPDTTRTQSASQHDSRHSMLLPNFIAPTPAQLLPEDEDFLGRKGAFVLPEPNVRDEILNAYLFSVHPFMPLLDVHAFVRAVNSENGEVSLLLFQAVMFAGLHSLPHEVMYRLGFQTVKQARETFFDRVRLLYDFNVETNDTAVLQSLILMSSWYSKRTPWNEKRHTWHWTGLAYDLARNMGLHRQASSRRIPTRECRFRRRLWWSLYIRDRLIALGTRRPMRIHDDEFDVSMLTMDDFDANDHSSDLGHEMSTPGLDDTSSARLCIQLARLCVCIGRVVSSQYTTIGAQAEASHSMMVMPKRDGCQVEELHDCEQELQTWNEELARNVRRSEFPSTGNACKCAEFHWSQLKMTYLTVINVLHRAQALRSESSDEAPAAPSRVKVKKAARSITKLAQDMLQNDQIRFLGLIGVTAFLAACLTHLLDSGSPDEDVRDASTFRLYQTLQALQALRQIYASADSAFSFLASVIRRAGIYIPLQTELPTVSLPHSSPASLMAAQPLNHLQEISSQGAVRFAGPMSGNPGQCLEAHALASSERANIVSGRSTQSLLSSNMQRESSEAQGVEGLTPFRRAEYNRYSLPSATHTPNPANAALTGTTFDWAVDTGTNTDLEYLPFTYDFFSDALGFLDNDLQAL